MKMIIRKLLVLSTICVACFGSEMYPISASEKAFFEQVRKAVLADDAEWLSGAIAYPINVYPDNGVLPLKEKADFKKNATTILGPHLKSVVKAESTNTLWKNWRGVSIGRGDIWYSEVDVSVTNGAKVSACRIIAINLNTDLPK